MRWPTNQPTDNTPPGNTAIIVKLDNRGFTLTTVATSGSPQAVNKRTDKWACKCALMVSGLL
eukprot:4046256-Amphidinium_carterae.1